MTEETTSHILSDDELENIKTILAGEEPQLSVEHMITMINAIDMFCNDTGIKGWSNQVAIRTARDAMAARAQWVVSNARLAKHAEATLAEKGE